MKITIKDAVTPKLKEIRGGLTKRKPLHAAMGKRGEILLRAHFTERDAEPNAKGWTKQHFWGDMRKATAYRSANEKGAIVAVADRRLNQKIYGGTLKPKESKYLAIPAIAEAYGKRPSLFPFLKVHRFKSGAVALVETDRTLLKVGKKSKKTGKRKIKDLGRSKRGRVWYWLARSVKQAKDARALPTEQSVTDAMVDEVRMYVDRVIAKQAKG